MDSLTLTRRFVISGSVQGVGYRMFAVHAASERGLAGYVRNLRDGRVEVYAAGPPAQLAALRADLQRGPRAARVTSFTEQDAPLRAEYSSSFSIEFDR